MIYTVSIHHIAIGMPTFDGITSELLLRRCQVPEEEEETIYCQSWFSQDALSIAEDALRIVQI